MLIPESEKTIEVIRSKLQSVYTEAEIDEFKNEL